MALPRRPHLRLALLAVQVHLSTLKFQAILEGD
jgi:hypothetical protein